MTIEITLNKKHYADFCASMLNGAFHGKTRQSLHPDFASVIMVVIPMILFPVGMMIPSDLAGHMVHGIAFGFTISWLTSILIRKIQNKQAEGAFGPHDDDPLFQKTAYTFTNDRIECRSETGGSDYLARHLIKLMDQDDLMMIFKSNREAYIFPKEQLTGDQITFIHEWAARHIPRSVT